MYMCMYTYIYICMYLCSIRFAIRDTPPAHQWETSCMRLFVRSLARSHHRAVVRKARASEGGTEEEEGRRKNEEGRTNRKEKQN